MVALWLRAFGALEDLCVGIPQFDSQVPLFFFFVLDWIDGADGSNNSTLPMGHVPDGANVDGGLPGYDAVVIRFEPSDFLVILF